ncbi:DUF3581 family protein [Thiorhodococcus minor]|uniref:DUF3581 domain-containing protein n=1 Tax=Thiorhodococcus minor TaxID=57489 RepID=A0A6M0JWC4_9GAMM|nr:DUF3581 family protein [Thiorhodococcus minor]NEV61241.1 DUF3581 domain-containing protein [Thiorhodococcus minor]
MFLDLFHTAEGEALRISASQGSAFAKQIAGDFNPIHDATNPRFCVPGDLLFALVLGKFGVASRMAFRFTGMVAADAALRIVETDSGLVVESADGKPCLEVERAGAVNPDPGLTESLLRRYVAFSGQNFPHILVPLMEQQGVMINPDRPLVIYDRMSFELDRLDYPDLEVALESTELEVKGKRGEVRLEFSLTADGQAVGRGAKTLILSGLRAYDAAALQGLVDRYAGWKAAYLAETESGVSRGAAI